jgi:hypothetical protein
VVTPEVVLLFAPALVLVTLKMMVQLPFAGMEILEKLRDVAPPVSDAGLAPQVPVTEPPNALMLVSVSETVPPLRGVEALLLEIVNVTTEEPPD